MVIVTSTLLCWHQAGHCRFCSTKRMWLLEEMKAACPSLVRGRQPASPWEQHCVLEKGKQQGGRWSERMSGQGTSGDTAESNHTGCRHQTPAEPCPKCNTWPSPNGTKTCCSESNLPPGSQFCKWVANLSHFCADFCGSFCSSSWRSFGSCSMLMSGHLPSKLWSA